MPRYSDLIKFACCVAVAAAIFPMGSTIYPHVAWAVGGFAFETIEAMVSATLGFGLYLVLFG